MDALEKFRKILEPLGKADKADDLYGKAAKIIGEDREDVLDRIIADTEEFIKMFGSYLASSEFKERVFNVIEIAYEICDKPEDLKELLVKTAVVNFLEIFINYSNISQRERVLDIFGNSLGNLDSRAQILNICIMVDPIFKSSEYAEDKKKIEETEIVYKHEDEIPAIVREIKENVDRWIGSQYLDLDRQEELINELRAYVKKLAEEKGLDTSSSQYRDLENECVEMLRMQFTSLALIKELEDEDLSPVPIGSVN